METEKAVLVKSASSKGSELDDWTLRESGAASGTYTAEGKPRASEAGWRGMNKWGHPKGSEFQRMWQFKLHLASRILFQAGCLDPRGVATWQTGQPRTSFLLLSSSFGQQTKDSGGRFGSWDFLFVFHIRAIQTLAKRSAIFRKVRMEAHRGR